MNKVLTPANAALLILPPLLWAGNAVLGRVVSHQISLMTLNFLRSGPSVFAAATACWQGAVTRQRPMAKLATLCGTGLLGVGSYNSLQYLALHTSTPFGGVERTSYLNGSDVAALLCNSRPAAHKSRWPRY